MSRHAMTVFLSAILLLGLTAMATAGQLDTRHLDHRTTAKLLIQPEWDAIQGLSPEGTAHAFLETRGDAFGLPADLGNLVLAGERESLLARHFTFQQMLNGVPVDHAEVIVSVSKEDGRVIRSFNNSYPVADAAAVAGAASLSLDQAYEAAWQRLRVHGELSYTPLARLVYTPEGETFRLNWIVDYDLTGPAGAWQVRIDAGSGQVVELTDRALPRKVTPETERSLDDRINEYQGPLAFRQAEFEKRTERDFDAAEARDSAAKSRASGTALTFDPDPRTTLRDNYLRDSSPAGSFSAAYYTRDLLDIAYNGSYYSLDGPWVEIINFESPNTAPSTTTDGNWDRARGVNSFNDALCYFHLDQNQRYMQALGFTGDMAIQDGPIGCDSDGLNGADNSHYIPSSNRLAFGHGCVDDSEDADVVLHEYGHGINHDINNSWYGGDTGAMGEGFGDYWGAAYSYGTYNGDVFFKNYIFHWDGHGAGNWCWYGRILNAHNAQYVHSTTYGAHQGIPGGYQSDELWSTPCYQTMLTCVETHGETKDSVDAIMLESQFGLGSGLKMRDMANVIIATAQAMEPDGPHAAVFVEKFLVHNIILAPVPVVGVEAFDITYEPSGNGAADPGETVSVSVTLGNNGLSSATGVTAVLTATVGGVNVSQDTANFGDLAVGGSTTGDVDYTFSVDQSMACGTLMTFNIEVNYSDGGNPTSVDRHGQLFAGVPVGGYGIQTPYQPMPDNTGDQIFSTITVSGTGAVVSEGINMDINITHSHIGDIVMWLTSPSGTRAYLHLLGGGSADDIIGNYPGTLTPGQSFDRFYGEPLDGDWELMVRDGGDGGTGTLNYWAFYDISDFECDIDILATPDLVPTTFALAQNAPNPFNPATTIAFEVPANAGLVTLAIYDVSGRQVRTLAQESLAPGQHTRTWQGRDDGGRAVASGVYFYKLTGDGFTQTRKMVVVQ